MAGLIYFLPDIYSHQLAAGRLLSHAILAERGIDKALADCPLRDQSTLIDLPGRGPDQRCGMLLVPLPNHGRWPVRLGYMPDCQVWRPAYPDDPAKLWIGYDISERPTPEDLRRRNELVAGYDRTLGDGQSWHVPVVRRPVVGTTHLPCSIEFDSAGRARCTIKDAYREIWERMGYYCEAAAEKREVDIAEAVKFAIDILSLNYRVSIVENNVLGIVDAANWSEIIRAAMDEPWLLDVARAEAEKKRPDPGANTTPGCEDSHPTTGPAGPSSKQPCTTTG
jgi:hypothetical protein